MVSVDALKIPEFFLLVTGMYDTSFGRYATDETGFARHILPGLTFSFATPTRITCTLQTVEPL